MRLLDLEECDLESGHLSLRAFSGTAIPPYAILSHRWTDDEVLFKDVENGTSADRKGYSKVQGAIAQAKTYGLAYLWDDTCCIDKSSSAELSEAINSMWAWYRHSSTCFAYLDDVVASSGDVEDTEFEAHFKSSAWFTRGWTLQELIAPSHVNFYNRSWAFIGNRQTLQKPISEATGIDGEYLNHDRPLSAASVAKRMSWAAQRRTRRPEDAAYCLMGLFSVNMPMLYGEASRAFQRLQEEILKSSDDESIFAWSDEKAEAEEVHGLLADGPFYFKDAGDIGPMLDLYDTKRKPWQTTNLGLNIQRTVTSGQMPLFCGRRGQPGYLSIATASVGERSVRCDLAKLRNCMLVPQDGDLYFPQEVPHVDRLLPIHETIIRYTIGMSPTMSTDGTWSQQWQKTGLHPMNKSSEPGDGWSGINAVPKQGTYVDQLTLFTHSNHETRIMVLIGVINGSELAFAVSSGKTTQEDQDYDSDPRKSSKTRTNTRFAVEASRIGSVVHVSTRYRVSVFRVPFQPCASAGPSDPVVGLLVDIRALVDNRQSEDSDQRGDSCCCVS